jgi:hypothetical protein
VNIYVCIERDGNGFATTAFACANEKHALEEFKKHLMNKMEELGWIGGEMTEFDPLGWDECFYKVGDIKYSLDSCPILETPVELSLEEKSDPA